MPNELQEASPGVVVVRVGFEVFGQVVYPLGNERDLDLCGAAISLPWLELVDDSAFPFLFYHSVAPFTLTGGIIA